MIKWRVKIGTLYSKCSPVLAEHKSGHYYITSPASCVSELKSYEYY
jgi:hypothetical protein